MSRGRNFNHGLTFRFKSGFPPGIQVVMKSLSQKLSSGARVWSGLLQQVGFPSQGTASIITMPKERPASTDALFDWHTWVASLGVSPFFLYSPKQPNSSWAMSPVSFPGSQTGCWLQRLEILRQVSTPFTFKKLSQLTQWAPTCFAAFIFKALKL